MQERDTGMNNMKREIKFRVWDKKEKEMLGEFTTEDFFGGGEMMYNSHNNCEFLQFTGLTDKNGIEGYFDSSIWEIKNYEWSEESNMGGYYTRHCDLRFILHQGLLSVEYELINPPKGLTYITLAVIFNLETATGKRLYIDSYRQSLEIIGNIYENPELL